MANTYLPAQQYVEMTLARLLQLQNLSGLITPFSGEKFKGTLNDTLIYRTEGVTIARDYEFRTRTAPIIFDEIYRNSLSIKLDKHMTVGNKWTDEERTFDLTSLESEIATPMAAAMVRKFDGKIKTALQAADWAVTDLNGTEPALADEKDNSALKIALGWKAKLDAVGTPNPRTLVLGANAFQFFAASKSTLAYDISQARSVYQRGVYGRIADFDIFNGTGIVGDNEVIAVNPSWAVLANAAPENVPSLSFCARRTVGGFSARLAAQFDINYATERLLLNTFWGLSEIEDQYARHTTATAATANDGSVAGDIVIEDGAPKFTGKNARGGKGTWTPLA